MPVEVPNVADALRLVAVPVLGWAALRDVEVRRVPTRTWYPLVALGVALLAWDAWRLYGGGDAVGGFERRVFPLRVAVSLGVVAPFSYLVWRMGWFGGADAKALIALAVLWPSYPTYVLAVGPGAPLVVPHPAGTTTVGVFSLTVLTNTVLLGAAYPLALAVRNLLARDLAPVLPFGRPVPAGSIVDRHGSLLETPGGYTRRGLDVDALRMYLRWRGATLADLRAAPDRFRDPASLPAERNDPGDGAVAPDGTRPGAEPDPASDGRDDGPFATDGANGGREDAVDAADGNGGRDDDRADGADGPSGAPPDVDPDDEWGAAAFLDDVGWGAYGTDPADLRAGLEVLATSDEVWYSPGLPFIVPMFLGLLVALTAGDLLFYALRWLALA